MKSLVIALTITVTVSLAANAADPLTVARDLYASAAYEEALAALTEARKANPKATPENLQLDEYRVFCLYALGRRGEADALAQTIVRTDPFIKVADDASPAIGELFENARKQTFPGMIRDKYRDGKAAIDRKDFASAEPQLVEVQRLISEWTKLGGKDDALNDLGVLVDGFLALGRRERADAEAAAQATAAAAAAAAARATPEVMTYGSESPGVTPPVTIAQALPPVPADIAKFGDGRGVLEVTIEATGQVSSVVVRESLNPSYDRLAVDAARRWQYKPATKDGQPVRFVKRVAISFKPQE